MWWQGAAGLLAIAAMNLFPLPLCWAACACAAILTRRLPDAWIDRSSNVAVPLVAAILGLFLFIGELILLSTVCWVLCLFWPDLMTRLLLATGFPYTFILTWPVLLLSLVLSLVLS